MEDSEKTVEKKISIALDRDDFEGVTAHMFQMLATDNGEVRLDCIYVDQAAFVSDADEVLAKVVARINMSEARARELRDLLDRNLPDTGDKKTE